MHASDIIFYVITVKYRIPDTSVGSNENSTQPYYLNEIRYNKWEMIVSEEGNDKIKDTHCSFTWWQLLRDKESIG